MTTFVMWALKFHVFYDSFVMRAIKFHLFDLWSQCQKVLKSSFLDVILSTSATTARKCSNRVSWTLFWWLLGQGQKVLKSSFLDVILSTSGAHTRKCSNRVSWTSVCRLLGQESSQIEFPALHFIDFWSQSKKVFKSSLLDVILPTSGAKARKCSNRAS